MPRQPPPWLFGITGLPSGIFQGFLSVAMPFLLRKAGVPVEQIATASAAANIPTIYFFLWAPIVDLGLKRRSWLMLSSIASGICASVAFLLSLPGQLSLFIFLVTLACALNTMVSSSNGALMASTLPENLRGRASGWYQFANVGGLSIGGGVLLWLDDLLSLQATAIALAIMITLPSLAAFFIYEERREPIALLETWRVMATDVWSILRSRAGIVGLIFFLAPVNSGALMNLFSAVAVDYKAPVLAVTWITGIGGGLMSAVGSLAGGYLCDRIGRRSVYVLSGILFILCAFAMGVLPMAAPTYIIGSSVYLFLLGVAYAAFTALVLDVIGSGGRCAATSYSLFVSAGNVPVVFMTWFDGKGYGAFGPRGLMGFEALGNLVGTVIIIVMIKYVLLAETEPA